MVNVVIQCNVKVKGPFSPSVCLYRMEIKSLNINNIILGVLELIHVLSSIIFEECYFLCLHVLEKTGLYEVKEESVITVNSEIFARVLFSGKLRICEVS